MGPTELRIHGVGGTSPEDLLDHPHPVQVAGDATSGFYRRWDPDAEGPPRGAQEHHVEGFSWGGLTSGSGRRALWLLLTPFLLVNVAHWALPGRAARHRWANTAAQRVLRLFALSLTVTLVLAAAETGVDLLARQSAGTTCFKSAPSWLSALATHRAVLVCLGAVIPLGAIALLGVLGRATWKMNEAVDPRPGPGQPTSRDDPALCDPLFWAGSEPVRRLRAVHLAAALATAAVIEVLAVLDGPRRSYAIAVVVAAGLALAAAAVLATGEGVARPHHRRWSAFQRRRDLSNRAPWLMGAAAAVFASSVVVVLLPHAVATVPAAGHDLPRLDGLVQALFGAQTVMILLLVVFVLLAGLQPGAVQAGRRRSSDQLIAPALCVMAWLTAWFFTAGVTVRVAAQLFGHAQGSVPATYIVLAALIAPGGALILLGIGAAGVVWYRAEASRQRTLVADLAPPAGPGPGAGAGATAAATAATGSSIKGRIDRRISTLAAARTKAGLLDIAPQLVVASTAALVVVAVVGLGLAQSSRHLTNRHWIQQLADLGTLLLALGILRFLAVAKKAWQDVATRRSIGILWDLGTFWPRAAHPLAPPCYCERALPQLQTRLSFCGARPDDHVVVAGHSQGSVIAAALVLMPRPALVPARLSLLTYGCPLGRLYARAFPGYLGPQVLGVGSPRGDPPTGPPPATVRSRSWQWLNLYRATDPIGGYVDAPVADAGSSQSAFGASGARRTGAVDVVLVDPVFAVPDGDIFPAAPAAHSHYREDPAYDVAIDELL